MSARTADSEWHAARTDVQHCRNCPLWKNATQAVFGEGPLDAPLMFVGEQPGDKEDIAGKPFVGPAGRVLDRALTEAGITRDKAYITNAVKHFKFVPRGKIRLHQKPNSSEIAACHTWLEREREIVKPKLIVALGATAAQSIFGKVIPIGKNRGRIVELVTGTKAMVTIHPSYLLRMDDADKAREFERFLEDLRLAAPYARKRAA
jgi:DNA polymerase